MLIIAMERMKLVGGREISTKCARNFFSVPTSSSSISYMHTSGAPSQIHRKTTIHSSRKSTFHSIALSSSSHGIIPIATTNAANSQLRKRPGWTNFQPIRFMNRNARRPKKANHGKRPCSHARRHAKRGKVKSRAYRERVFGFF